MHSPTTDQRSTPPLPASEHPASPRAMLSRRAWIALLLAGAIVRGAALLFAGSSLAADPDAYRTLAQTLVQHGTYAIQGHPTAYRPPLYPLLLAAAEMLPGDDRPAIALLHWLLGIATVGLVAHLAQRAGLGRGSIIAALLVAFDPILIHWSRFVMSETLATCLAVVSCIALHRYATSGQPRSAALAGTSLALAALCRPVFLVWFALCVVATWFVRSRLQSPQPFPSSSHERPRSLHGAASHHMVGLRHAAAMALGGILVLSPWVVRNALQFGQFIPATTHGGYTLLLGNNPHFYAYLRQHNWGVAWQPDAFFDDYQTQKPPVRTPHDEWRADRQAYRLAWQAIRREPAMFLRATAVRIARLWSPLPHRLTPDEQPTRRWLRYGVAIWYTLEMLAAIVGVWALGKRWATSPWLWALLLVLAVTAVHAFYWSNLRMRAPLIPVVALVAACGAQCTRKP